MKELKDLKELLELKELKELCRHRDFTTTMQYYIEADDAEIRSAVDRLEEGTA